MVTFSIEIAICSHALQVLCHFSAAAAAVASSSALQEGAHTAWDLPKTFRVVINERALCLPHKKHDMVAPPKDAAAMNGEPDTLDL
jgi:hypothetical protein